MGIGKKYEGVIVPMVSPFNAGHQIDEDSAGRLVEHLVENRAIPFILGTTGEAASMTEIQKLRLAERVALVNRGRGPLIAGISSGSLETSVRMAGAMADLGIELAVATLPSVYPISPEQMYSYFVMLADSIPIPLMLYNMPLTTGLSIPVGIVDRLSQHPNIAGIKDSERDDERLDRSLHLWSGRDDFSFLPGWAVKSAYALGKGADGIVPSSGNLEPGMHRELFDSAKKGDHVKALEFQGRIDRISLLYQEGRNLNESIPALKVLLYIRNLCSPHVLPPLSRMEENEEREYMEQMSLKLESIAAG